MVEKGSCICFGNPLLDMSVTLKDDSLMQKYELKPSNAILADEKKHLPLYEEIEKDASIEYIAGGAGQNSVRVAQWMLNDERPQACTYVGAVGKDENGKRLEAACSADGVKVHYQITEDVPTGCCAVLIHNRERSMVANLAAANHYKVDHFNQKDTQDLLDKAKIVYITSFFLTVSPETANKVGVISNEKGKKLLMNLAAPFLIEVPFFFERVKQLISYADYCFGNEHEAAALGKTMGWGEDVVEIAKRLQKEPKADGKSRIVIFTQGQNPAIVVTEGGIVHEYPPTLLKKEEIVDLNGAGDAFCGGFIAALAKGKNLEECVNAGHFAASKIIQVSGCNTKALGPSKYFESH